MVKEKTKPDHDECVRNIAEELKSDNWQVKANVEGWEKPSKKGEVIPDIEAHKGCFRRICEVLTLEEFKADKKRYRHLKDYCDEYDFQMYIIDKDGKRKQIDPQTFGKKANSRE